MDEEKRERGKVMLKARDKISEGERGLYVFWNDVYAM